MFDFLPILECLSQPVWVVDPDGLVDYVNPAGLAALGYDHIEELRGRPGHETIHYKHRDGTPFPASECPMTESRSTGAVVHCDEDWFVRRDGAMTCVSYTSVPISTPTGAGCVVAFTDLDARRRAERAAHERDVAEARAAEARAAQRRIVEAADAARAQLERDLHDGAQQHFVSARVNLRLAERLQERDPASARDVREAAIELTTDGLDELRRLARGLHPAVLDDHGLDAALRQQVARLPLPVEVLEAPRERLSPSIEASAFFVVSEALANVVKHADASAAAVRVALADGRLDIEVRDDGVGGADAGGGSGLRGLADRVYALEGTLAVDSPPGAGTVLRAHIPVH